MFLSLDSHVRFHFRQDLDHIISLPAYQFNALLTFGKFAATHGNILPLRRLIDIYMHLHRTKIAASVKMRKTVNSNVVLVSICLFPLVLLLPPLYHLSSIPTFLPHPNSQMVL